MNHRDIAELHSTPRFARSSTLAQPYWSRLAALIIFVATVSGCATLSHGSTQTIQLVSDPPGAQVTVDLDPVPYISPAKVTLKRGEDHVLVFRKDGFEDYSAELTRSVSGAVFGNLLFGGVEGLMTDSGTGAAYELGHANLINGTLTVRLVPKSSTVSAASSRGPLVTPPAPEAAFNKGTDSLTQTTGQATPSASDPVATQPRLSPQIGPGNDDSKTK